MIRVTNDLATCLSIRRSVFAKELGLPEALVLDGNDYESIHFLAQLYNKPVGTARLSVDEDQVTLDRVCVLKEHRGKGLGSGLVDAAVNWCRKRGVKRASTLVRSDEVAFSENMGFRSSGPVFMSKGIARQEMARNV